MITIAYISIGVFSLFLLLMIFMIVVSILLLKKLKSTHVSTTTPSSVQDNIDLGLTIDAHPIEEMKTERSKSKSIHIESIHIPTPKKINTKSENRKSRFSNVLEKL